MTFASIEMPGLHSFGGRYGGFKSSERVVHADAFETHYPDKKSGMLVTVRFADFAAGTEIVVVVHEGIPASPVEDARAGWTIAIDNPGRLVEI